MKDACFGKHSFHLWGTLAAAAVTAAAVLFSSSVQAEPITEPIYPDWESTRDERLERELNQGLMSREYQDALRQFDAASASVILTGEKGNRMYSPVSLAAALSMLAETTGGDTRAEILQALGVRDVGVLRGNTGKLFRSLDQNGERGTLRLANSVWLGKDVPFYQETLDLLTKDYYAYSAKVDFSSPLAGREIGKWIGGNTGGLLGRNFHADADTMAILLNTIYFQADWSKVFQGEDIADALFTPEGKAAFTASFLTQSFPGEFISGDGWTGVSLDFRNGCRMNLILPQEGSTPERLLEDKARLSRVLWGEGEAEWSDITLRLPKFQFGASLDLAESLKKLGVKSAFQPGTANFGPLSPDPICLSKAVQKSTISIDENGCEAAAYTRLDIVATAAPPPPEKLPKRELNLNRPFLFTIEGSSHGKDLERSLLFIGVVEEPSAK